MVKLGYRTSFPLEANGREREREGKREIKREIKREK
jgi:hypothetical protein